MWTINGVTISSGSFVKPNAGDASDTTRTAGERKTMAGRRTGHWRHSRRVGALVERDDVCNPDPCGSRILLSDGSDASGLMLV